MSMIAPRLEPTPRASVETLHHLEAVSASRGDEAVGRKIVDLRAWVEADLADVERDLAALDHAPAPVGPAAAHLLALGGKRLRPLCVALASRLGAGFSRPARDLAVAAELMHNATLLHDDVVDLGDVRRGAPAARVVYGNAASIFAGDWLLVEAMSRIRASRIDEALDRAIAVLRQMLAAEALQLAARGTFSPDLAQYLRVVEGKTASLFEWALYVGARAGGLADAHCDAVAAYGRHLGVCFQVVDDLLDVAGDPAEVGKTLFADLREAKLTYPLLLAVQRDEDFGRELREALDGVALPPDLAARAGHVLRATGAIEDTQGFARRLAADATRSLATLPPSRARESLEHIAAAMLQRRK